MVSVGVGHPCDWQEFPETPLTGPRAGWVPGRTWTAPTSFCSHETDRVTWDLDGLDESLEDPDPETMRRIAALFPPGCEVIASPSSPTGMRILASLRRRCSWRKILSKLDALRSRGRELLEAVGRGGHVDEAAWHPQAMVRLPGWRTLTKGPRAGSAWLVRWWNCRTLIPLTGTGGLMSLYEHMDPDQIDAARKAFKSDPGARVHPTIRDALIWLEALGIVDPLVQPFLKPPGWQKGDETEPMEHHLSLERHVPPSERQGWRLRLRHHRRIDDDGKKHSEVSLHILSPAGVESGPEGLPAYLTERFPTLPQLWEKFDAS